MKTKKDFLIEAVINGNNSFDIDRDYKITEDVLNAMESYTKHKLNKPDVSQQREQLLAYHEWYLKHRSWVSHSAPNYMVDMYLSQ